MPRKHRGFHDDPDLGDRDQASVSQRLGANVKRYRAAAGLTQEQLSEKVGCATTWISKVERGGDESNATIRMLGALARALDIDVMRLLAPRILTPNRRGRPPDAGRRKRTVRRS